MIISRIDLVCITPLGAINHTISELMESILALGSCPMRIGDVVSVQTEASTKSFRGENAQQTKVFFLK